MYSNGEGWGGGREGEQRTLEQSEYKGEMYSDGGREVGRREGGGAKDSGAE